MSATNNNGQKTLFSYFKKKEIENEDETVTCPLCKASLKLKQLSWHRDFDCRISTFHGPNGKIFKEVEPKKMVSRDIKCKKKIKIMKPKCKKGKQKANENDVLVIYQENKDSSKSFDKSPSSLLIVNDMSYDSNESLPLNIEPQLSDERAKTILKFESPKTIPYLPKDDEDVCFGFMKLSSGLDSEDEFQSTQTAFASPKPSPRRQKKVLLNTPSKSSEFVSLGNISDVTSKPWNICNDTSNSNSGSEEYYSPVHPSMLVSPQRTPSPSPTKKTPMKCDISSSLSRHTCISSSLLRTPQKFGLKVSFHNSVKKNLNSDQVSPKNVEPASPSFQYRGKFTPKSIRHAMSFAGTEASTSVEVSPSCKTLDLAITSNEPPSNSSPSKFRRVKGVYLESFLFILDTILSEPKDFELLNADDLNTIQNFNTLSLSAQKLYVRLFQRKIKWLRLSKLDYKDVCDKEEIHLYINELISFPFLYSEESLSEIIEVLSLLSAGELQNLCKNFKIDSRGKKESLIERIKKFSCQQRTVFASFPNASSCSSSETIIIKQAKQMIGKCFIINQEVFKTFMRMFLMFAPLPLEDDENGGQQTHMFNLLMVTLGKKTYPPYQVIRKHALYRCRADLLRIEKCYSFYCDIQERIEKRKYDEAETIGKDVKEYYHCLKSDEEIVNHDLNLPDFLRRYTAVSLLLHILTLVVEVHQKLKHYKKAVSLLEELVSQKSHLQDYRGRWFDRLALNLDQHLKNTKKSLEVIKDALLDPEVRVGYRLALSQRAKRLLASKKGSNLIEAFDGQLDIITFREPHKQIIEAKCLPVDNAGFKSIFINSYSPGFENEQTLCSVEELAISYYKMIGYPEGLHFESRTAHCLFGIYFWDVIYSQIPDVFRSAHQSVPFDLDSRHFYESRKVAIDCRLQDFEKKTMDEINEEAKEIWLKHEGETCIVDWNIFKNFGHFAGLASSLGSKVVSGICRRLTMDHRFTRSGFPDLIVWNPKTKESRIVEVKGPNDRLSNKQILWLDFLINIGAKAEVCHVEVPVAWLNNETCPYPTKTLSEKQLKQLRINGTSPPDGCQLYSCHVVSVEETFQECEERQVKCIRDQTRNCESSNLEKCVNKPKKPRKHVGKTYKPHSKKRSDEVVEG